jgi:hypothetical protein
VPFRGPKRLTVSSNNNGFKRFLKRSKLKACIRVLVSSNNQLHICIHICAAHFDAVHSVITLLAPYAYYTIYAASQAHKHVCVTCVCVLYGVGSLDAPCDAVLASSASTSIC